MTQAAIMTTTTVEVQQVHKVYQRDSQQIPVLEGINLSVPEGEFVALMGPSGSGKTTLLNLIAGIDRPTSGNIFVAGTNLATLSEAPLAPRRSRHICFLLPFFHLLSLLIAVGNI